MMDHVSLKEVSSSLKLRKAPPQRRYVGLLFRGRLKQWSDSSGRTLSSDGSYPPPATFVTTNANHLPSILKYPTQSLSLAHEFLSNHCNEEEEEQQEERKKQLIDNTPHSDHKRTRCKQVRFGDLTISSHEIILGDNPAVSSGFPITIEWKAFAEVKETIEEYEQQKKKNQIVRVEIRGSGLTTHGARKYDRIRIHSRRKERDGTNRRRNSKIQTRHGKCFFEWESTTTYRKRLAMEDSLHTQ
jgi:hypothetical protein